MQSFLSASLLGADCQQNIEDYRSTSHSSQIIRGIRFSEPDDSFLKQDAFVRDHISVSLLQALFI